MEDTIVYWLTPERGPVRERIAHASNAMTESEAIDTATGLIESDCDAAIFDVSERPSLYQWAVNMQAYGDCNG